MLNKSANIFRKKKKEIKLSQWTKVNKMTEKIYYFKL